MHVYPGYLSIVNGHWGLWADMQKCSKSCDGGTKVSERVCNNPSPSNGGNNCIGNNEDTAKPCNSKPCPDQFIFMVAGEDASTEISSDVEIVTMFPRPSCPKPPNFPYSNSLALIGMFINNQIVLCGFLEDLSSCYGLDIETHFNWIKLYLHLLEERSQAATVKLEDNSWLITGGQKYYGGAPKLLNTTEIVSEEKSVFSSELPQPLSGHCAITINSLIIFIAGGYGQPHLVDCFLLNLNNQTTSQNQIVAPMSQGRYGHACGRVKTQGLTKIIVVGGLRVDNSEIYLLDRNFWLNGPKVKEQEIFKSSVVNGPTSFALVGGIELEPCSTDTCRFDSIFIFDADENKWGKSEHVLIRGRGNHISINLPTDYICSSKIF